MNKLISKLEALTGPCFAVEQEIYQAVHPKAWQKRVDELLAGPLGPRLSPVDYSGYIKVPAFTASIDAAMTLVPEGWFWTYDGNRGRATCEGFETSAKGHQQRGYYVGDAPSINTPAIALCIAALKARVA